MILWISIPGYFSSVPTSSGVWRRRASIGTGRAPRVLKRTTKLSPARRRKPVLPPEPSNPSANDAVNVAGAGLLAIVVGWDQPVVTAVDRHFHVEVEPTTPADQLFVVEDVARATRAVQQQQEHVEGRGQGEHGPDPHPHAGAGEGRVERFAVERGEAVADGGLGYSCIAEQRTVETIREGKPTTPFLSFGDRVEIEMLDAQGRSIFGRIDQHVRRYEVV